VKGQLISAVLLAALAVFGCSSAKHSAPGPTPGGGAGRPPLVAGGADQGNGGVGAAADAGGEPAAPGGGQSGSGHSGETSAEAGQGGSSSAGTGSVDMPMAGAGPVPDPTPPVGDPPICPHDKSWAQGTRLAISGAGDDVLQAITPDELSIAWKNGAHFYVADRDDSAAAFGAPHEVANGAQYNSVALSSDGLLLVAIRDDLRVVEQVRTAGEAFSDPDPGPGDFQDFDNTLATIPLPNQVLTDAVLGGDDASFFFSHYLSSDAGSRPSLRESRRSNGGFSFGGPNPGELLYASGAKRRVPTGVSSDLLTLFYFDQVKGDFRAAWRINTQEPFTYSETLSPGAGTQAAAPNQACNRLYYSADGSDGVDLFTSNVSN